MSVPEPKEGQIPEGGLANVKEVVKRRRPVSVPETKEGQVPEGGLAEVAEVAGAEEDPLAGLLHLHQPVLLQEIKDKMTICRFQTVFRIWIRIEDLDLERKILMFCLLRLVAVYLTSTEKQN